MGREKYINRQRHVYALTFQSKPWHVYIGQSVDPKRRLAQHHQSGDWRGMGAVTLTPLAVYTGTRMDVERWELVWRVHAQACGWRVYGGCNDDGPYVVDPLKRATRDDLRMAKRCKWPLRRRNDVTRAMAIGLSALTLIGMIGHHWLVQ